MAHKEQVQFVLSVKNDFKATSRMPASYLFGVSASRIADDAP